MHSCLLVFDSVVRFLHWQDIQHFLVRTQFYCHVFLQQGSPARAEGSDTLIFNSSLSSSAKVHIKQSPANSKSVHQVISLLFVFEFCCSTTCRLTASPGQSSTPPTQMIVRFMNRNARKPKKVLFGYLMTPSPVFFWYLLTTLCYVG